MYFLKIISFETFYRTAPWARDSETFQLKPLKKYRLPQNKTRYTQKITGARTNFVGNHRKSLENTKNFTKTVKSQQINEENYLIPVKK